MNKALAILSVLLTCLLADFSSASIMYLGNEEDYCFLEERQSVWEGEIIFDLQSFSFIIPRVNQDDLQIPLNKKFWAECEGCNPYEFVTWKYLEDQYLWLCPENQEVRVMFIYISGSLHGQTGRFAFEVPPEEIGLLVEDQNHRKWIKQYILNCRDNDYYYYGPKQSGN